MSSLNKNTIVIFFYKKKYISLRGNFALKCAIMDQRCMVHRCSELDNLLQAARYTETSDVCCPGKEKKCMTFVDQTLYCRDCSQEFTFTIGEQEFFASRGLTNTPARCPSCRAERKQTGGGRGGARGGGRSREARQMYSVTCAGCCNPDQITFMPKCDRSGYCGDCYPTQSANQPLK